MSGAKIRQHIYSDFFISLRHRVFPQLNFLSPRIILKLNHLTLCLSLQWFEEKQQQFENLDAQLRKLHASVESLVCHRKGRTQGTRGRHCHGRGHGAHHGSTALAQITLHLSGGRNWNDFPNSLLFMVHNGRRGVPADYEFLDLEITWIKDSMET